MAIVDILIFVFFAWVMSSLAKKSERLFPNSSKMDYCLWCYIAFFTLISAIRWSVGVDSISYAQSFVRGTTVHEYLTQDENKELLMTWIVRGVHDSGLHFSFGLGFLAFLQIFFLTIALKEYKYVLITLPVVMFGSMYYLMLMNGVRQMIVACAFVWASKFIVEKNWKGYLLFLIVGYLMHNSVVMLAPFFFIPKRVNLAEKRVLCLIIFVICFILGNTPQFQSVVQYAERLAIISGYDSYADRVSDFLTTGYSEETRSFGPMQLSYLIVGFFTIWFGPILKERFDGKIPQFNLWYFFSFFYICAYFLVCNISHIFIRPVEYFALFHMIIVSLLLYYFGGNKARKHAIYFVFLGIIWVNTAWNMTKTNINIKKGGQDFSTYKTFFMHMDEVKKIK